MGNYSAEQLCRRHSHLPFIGLTILFCFMLATRLPAATVTKKNNANSLFTKGSWTGNRVPGVADIALWDSTVLGANTTVLGANLSWLGIQITNPGGAVAISTGSTLTLGSSGINMSSASQNLTLNCALMLGAAQIWDVTTGRTIAAAGVIGGSGSLTKNGLGTVTLTGVNTYTGGTTINAGTLAVNSGSSIGASSGAVKINAATLELLTGNTTSTTRTFQLGNVASTLQIDSGSILTISGAITNAATAGSLIKTGAGTLILSSLNGNTYGGAGQTTSINAGTLQVGADNVLGNSATTVTFNGGTLLFSAGFASSRSVIMTGSGTINTNNNAASLSGVISGAGPLMKNGAGTLTLSGTNTYAGGTTVTGGNTSILRVSSDNNLGSTSAGSLAAGLTLGGGSVLETTATFASARRIFLGATGGSSQPDGSVVSAIIRVDAGTSLTLTGQITGDGSSRLEKDGTGWLFLSNSNLAAPNQFGSLYLHGGLIITSTGPQFGNAITTADNGAGVVGNQIGAFTATIHIGNGGYLRESGTGFDVFRNGLIDNVSGQTGGLSYTGDETAAGGAAANAGKQGLGGSNTFVGGVSIGTNFTLSISQDANLGSVSNQLTLNGGTLAIEDGVTGASASSVGTPIAATFSSSRQINLNGSSIIDVRNSYDAAGNPTAAGLAAHVNTLTLNGVLTGSGSLTKTGLGVLTLTNTGNNYTGGTIINAGTLSTAAASTLGAAASSLTINPGGIFQATGSFTSSRTVTLGGTGGSASGGTFDVTSGVTEDGDGVISGSGSLTKTGSGVLELGAVNTYTGDTFVNGGVLITTNNQALGLQPTLGSSLYAVHLANGTTLQNMNSSTGTARQVELVSGTATMNTGASFTQQRNGLIYGAGGLIKAGTGTEILTNANTYTGGTTINSGILQINNTSGSGTGTGAVAVNSGGTLSGLPTATGFSSPGTISGTVSVNSGGAIDIRSGGTFTFGGLVLNTSAITNFQLGSLTATSLINVTGANGLSLSGLSTINISNFAGGLAAGTYHLIDYSGTALANLNNLQLGSTAGGAFTYSLSNNQTNSSIDLIVSTSSVQWGNDANGNWSATSNWTNSIPPNSAGASANFLGVINSPRTVTVNGAFTAGTLTFNNPNSYTIASDNVTGHGITLNNNGSASISVLAGSHTLAAPLALTDNVEIAAVGGTSLTISGAISENSAGRTVTSSGAGTVTFAGATANTYTGLTEVEAGTLNLNKTSGVNALGAGGLQIDAGATVALLGSNQLADTAAVTVGGTFGLGAVSETIGSLQGDGSVTLGSGSLLTIGGNNLDSDFAGVISGAGTLTKTGTGALELDGVNTFGGAGQTVTILGGQLQIAFDSSLGNAANSVTLNGGTEQFLSGFSSARSVILTGSGTFDTNNNSDTLSGTISGAGVLTKNGAGTLTLSGTNTFSGGTAITGGNSSVISIANASNLGSGALTIGGGSMLMSTADLTLTHGIILGAQGGGNQGDGNPVSGILNVATGTSLTLSSVGISETTAGTGRLEKIGGGTLYISAAGTLSGGTYLHEGTLVSLSPFALGPIGGAYPNPFTIDNNAQLVFAVSGAFNLPIFIGTGGGGVGATSASNVAFDNGVVSNVTAQSGGFAVHSGTIGFGGANSFSGNVTLDDGAALSISRDVNFGVAANQIFLANNSTLKIEDGVNTVSNTSVQATFASSRQINLTGGQATIEVDNTYNAINPLPTSLGSHSNILTLNGLVTGSGGLIKTGLGTLVLTNLADSYTGGTTINAGTLSVPDDTALGAANYGLTINPTGIFQTTGSFTTARATLLGGTGGASSGATFDVTSTNNETRVGGIDGTGSLTKTGTGTLSLFGAGTYTGGTYINAGILAINSSSSLGSASVGATIGNATLEVVNDVTTTRNFTISDANSTMQVDGSATYSLAGVLSGSGTLNKSGDGVLALTGTNTYTGGTAINLGTVVVNSAASLGNGGALSINGGTLEVATGYSTSRNIALTGSSSSIQVDPAQTYIASGVLSGAGSLTKNGTGTLSLTGINTFTGDTVVNYGILTVAASGSGALAVTASLTVNDSGTLLLGASNQINNAAAIAKGNFSEGTAGTVGFGALTLTGPGSNLDFGTGTVGVLSFASLNIGVDTLTIDNWTGTANTLGTSSTDRLIFDSDQTANLASFTFAGYGSGAATQFALGGGFYEITALDPVPEPSTWAAAALVVGALGFHYWKRRRRTARSAMEFQRMLRPTCSTIST